MKKISLLLLAAVMMMRCHTLYPAQQGVSGATPVAIDADGIAEGVLLFGQAVTPSTLTIPNGINVNETDTPQGISTDTPGVGTAIFQGTTGTSIVNGTVGIINPMGDIQAGLGSSTTTFNGTVDSSVFYVTGDGTVEFNNTVNTALQFNADGTVVIGAGITFNGSLFNLSANTGTLTLNNGSVLIGNGGGSIGALKQVNLIGGDALTTGGLSATNFSLGSNTLFHAGLLVLPANAFIDTTVLSNTVFGKIDMTGFTNTIDASTVTVNAHVPGGVILAETPMTIVMASAGTSDVPVVVTTDNIHYRFTGLNQTGSITITPEIVPMAEAVSNSVAASVATALDALVPVALANPGSDLAFIEAQLFALTTADELTDALLQISPVSGLVGVSRESFNATKQFQKIWLSHIRRNREQGFRPRKACSPCKPLYDGPKLWADGFALYGQQVAKDDVNGYHVNTWGGMLGLDMPWACGWRSGLGGGYSYTDLDENNYQNGTNITIYDVTAYLSYDTDPWFFDGGASIGYNKYQGKRNINFGEVHRTAHAKYDGWEYSEFLSTGYRTYSQGVEVTPFASVMHSHLHLQQYTETGAEALNLNIDSQSYDFVQSGVGLRTATMIPTTCGLIIPEVHFIWLHDFQTSTLAVNATFVGLGSIAGEFSNYGPIADRDTWNIGASITCLANDCFSIVTVADFEKSNTYYNYQGRCELSIRF